MSECELVMDVDNDLSFYHQVELPRGLKPGLELLPVPAPVGEEVVITDCGVPTSGVPLGDNQSHPAEVLDQDQAVEEFMVVLPLDDSEVVDGDYSMDSYQETAAAHHSSEYTTLEPATWSLGASFDSDNSFDSGLGASEKSSILSKKDSFSRLPSQGKNYIATFLEGGGV